MLFRNVAFLASTSFQLIGEFIGAIAVVVTLIYLSLQLRSTAEQIAQNLQSTKTQNWQAVNENFNTWRQMVLEGENTDVWYRGINSLDALTANEKQKFFIMAGAFDWSCWLMYQLQRNEGLMADVNQDVYRDQFMHSGYREWLKKNRHKHSDDYGDFLDRVAESVGHDRLEAGEFLSLSPGCY